MKRGRMCIACWTTKATNTHAGYVIFFAILRQQWLHECALALRYCVLFVTEIEFIFNKIYYFVLKELKNVEEKGNPIQSKMIIYIYQCKAIPV